MDIKTCLLIIQKNNLEADKYAKTLYEAQLKISHLKQRFTQIENEVEQYKKEYKSKKFNLNSHKFFNFSCHQLDKLKSEINILDSEIKEINKKIYFFKSQNSLMEDKRKMMKIEKEKKDDLIQTDEQNNFLFSKKTQEANS